MLSLIPLFGTSISNAYSNSDLCRNELKGMSFGKFTTLDKAKQVELVKKMLSTFNGIPEFTEIVQDNEPLKQLGKMTPEIFEDLDSSKQDITTFDLHR